MKRSKDNWEKAGYSLIGFGFLVMFTTLYFQYCTTVEATFRWTILSAGIGIVGIGIAMIAKGIAEVSWKIGHESDERMKAMANLEFYEKMAVVENYKSFVSHSNGQNVIVEAIYNDIKGAKQLKKYVKPEIEQELNTKIQELIDVALQGQPYGNLVSRLQDVQREDC